MRQSGGTIQQFIRRFDDTLAFGVTILGMTAVDDETQRIVFLSATRKVSALESFWRNETTRTDPERAGKSSQVALIIGSRV